MDLSRQASQVRFASYVRALVEVIGHADRAEPLNDYCVGLLMPGERKSVEPMAAIVAPARISAKHQSLLHLVGQAPWPDEAVLQKVRELVLPGIERQGRIEAWIVPFGEHRRHRFYEEGHTHPEPVEGRPASRANIVGGSANRTIVKSRLRCRSPIIRRACRSLTGSICRRHGQMMRYGGKRRMCRRISGSKPSRRSRSIRSAQPMRQVSPPVSSWPMRAMVQTATSVPVSVL
jgi:hypothetical protein